MNFEIQYCCPFAETQQTFANMQKCTTNHFLHFGTNALKFCKYAKLHLNTFLHFGKNAENFGKYAKMHQNSFLHFGQNAENFGKYAKINQKLKKIHFCICAKMQKTCANMHKSTKNLTFFTFCISAEMRPTGY